MGYIMHDAIVVTSWSDKHADEARAKAVDLGLPVSPLIKSGINDYVSFLIAPDGSKEGWVDSDKGDEARAKWIAWAEDVGDRNGQGPYFDWAHVRYGEDPPHLVSGSGDEEDVEDRAEAR